MRRSRTTVAVTVAVLGLLTGSASAAVPRVLSVGQVARQDVPSPAGGQSDVVLQGGVAAYPGRPSVALAVTEQGLRPEKPGLGAPGVALAAAVTRNGGASWTSAAVPGMTAATGGRWAGVSWPDAAVGADGTLYVVGALRQAGCENGLGLVRSTDVGRSWQPMVLATHLTTCRQLDARSSLAEDTGAHSPYRGRLHLAWTRIRFDAAGDDTGQVQLAAWSDDHGRTWSSPVALGSPPGFTTGTTVLVRPDGSVTSVYYGSPPDGSATYVYAQTSTDGGRSFAPATRITSWQFSTDGVLNVRCCQPSAAVDPVTGELYVAIDDARFRTGLRFDDAVVFRSSDGTHWSPPVRANRVDPGSDLEFATPEVAAYGGTLHVSWTLFGTGNGYRQQVATSRDGGGHFGPATTLGPDGDLRAAAKASAFGYWLADFTGLAAVPGKAYLAWPLSTRNGSAQHQTLWAATVSAAPAGPPATDLAPLEAGAGRTPPRPPAG